MEVEIEAPPFLTINPLYYLFNVVGYKLSYF